ncbi:hypothetical protein BDN72DRAFT_380570 [Pluteus cervinus]|uniref:Uncharacterized protein n=1 Tax=Pluteus cervinus TaxID=181527 RepID=A0ACD3B2U7_9AGAR|nr:hypothetical protein BDN72DRAFT_380570 [Pluteus cervinus]
MSTWKYLTIFTLAAFTQSVLAQGNDGTIITLPPQGLCESCLIPVAITNSVLYQTTPCSNPALQCCRLAVDYAVCLPQCPTVLFPIDPPITVIHPITGIHPPITIDPPQPSPTLLAL